MSELKTIYDCERAKFNWFGTYKLPIEERVNEIMEMTKKEYPTIDNYLLWVCAVEYVKERKHLFIILYMWKSKSRLRPPAREVATHTTQGRARFITRPPRCRRGADPVLVRLVARQWGGVGSAPVCVCEGPMGRASFALLGNEPSDQRGGSRDRVVFPHRVVIRSGLGHVTAPVRAGPQR